jgi:hypothetical protein
VCVNVSRETVQCAACLLLRERVGGAAFLQGCWSGFCEGGGRKHAPPSLVRLAAGTEGGV